MDKYDLFAKRCMRVKRLIESQPGISGTELSKATKTLCEDERARFLNILVAANEIRIEKVKGRGRPRVLYWPVVAATQQAAPQEAEGFAPAQTWPTAAELPAGRVGDVAGQ